MQARIVGKVAGTTPLTTSEVFCYSLYSCWAIRVGTVRPEEAMFKVWAPIRARRGNTDFPAGRVTGIACYAALSRLTGPSSSAAAPPSVSTSLSEPELPLLREADESWCRLSFVSASGAAGSRSPFSLLFSFACAAFSRALSSPSCSESAYAQSCSFSYQLSHFQTKHWHTSLTSPLYKAHAHTVNPQAGLR